MCAGEARMSKALDVSVLQLLANAVAVSLDGASSQEDRQRALQVCNCSTLSVCVCVCVCVCVYAEALRCTVCSACLFLSLSFLPFASIVFRSVCIDIQMCCGAGA